MTYAKKKFREIIFEVIIASEIFDRFDSSNNYCDKFNARKEDLHKCLSYFEIENIDNFCFLTITCNPKEYYEIFENNFINKNIQELKKVLPK